MSHAVGLGCSSGRYLGYEGLSIMKVVMPSYERLEVTCLPLLPREDKARLEPPKKQGDSLPDTDSAGDTRGHPNLQHCEQYISAVFINYPV